MVIGSGFIGCEIAVVAAHPRSPGDPGLRRARAERRPAGANRPAHRSPGGCERQGVALHLDSAVRRIERTGDELEVIADGASARGRVVVMAAGVAPRGELAAAAGIELDGRRDASRRRDALGRSPACWPPATCAWPTTSRRAGRCASSTGATRSPRARSPARSLRRAACRVGRGPRLLVDDRRPHAEVRRLGRRLRRVALRARHPTAASAPGTGATGSSSACSPTRPTRTTSAAQGLIARGRRGARRGRRRPGPRRGAPDRGLPARRWRAQTVPRAAFRDDRRARCLPRRTPTGVAADVAGAARPRAHACSRSRRRAPGAARRAGMDTAADRLLELGRAHGLIACTDADSRPARTGSSASSHMWQPAPGRSPG